MVDSKAAAKLDKIFYKLVQHYPYKSSTVPGFPMLVLISFKSILPLGRNPTVKKRRNVDQRIHP